MFRRMLLAVSFIAALGVAGFGASGTAEAHGCHHGHGGRGFYGASYGPGYGYYPRVYRTSYYPSVYYGAPYYGGAYYGGGCYRPGGLSLSFGF